VSAVDIYVVDGSYLLTLRKRQVQWIGSILHTPNSQMVALVSKYTMDARIEGWFKQTYFEFELDAPEELDTPEELETLTWLYH